MRSSVVIALLLFPVALAVAEDFKEAKKRFEKAFDPSKGSRAREAAAKEVAGYGTKDAAKLLVSGIETTRMIIDALVRERQDAFRGIGDFEDGDARPRLVELKKLIDRETRVLEAIEKGLARMKDPKAFAWLHRDALSRSKPPTTRETIAIVLGKIGDPAAIPSLRKALKDKIATVRAAVAIALGRLSAKDALPDLLKLLGDKAWTVKAAAIEALGAIDDPRAIPALVEFLAKERGRLAEDAADALERISGQRFGSALDAWRRWLDANRERVESGKPFPKPEDDQGKKSDGGFYGIPVRSERAIFILDISESMSYGSKEQQAKPGPDEESRLDLAKRELRRALHAFSAKGTFCVLAFETRVVIWRKSMQAATRKNRDAAAAWATALKPTGTTNIYAALEKAFEMAGMGVTDKHYGLAADTIYLLSDGAPTNDDCTDDDPGKVLRAVRRWNRLKRVKIHTIGLMGHNRSFLSSLAKENGGTYVSR